MTVSAALAVSQTQAFWGKGHLIGKQQKLVRIFYGFKRHLTNL